MATRSNIGILEDGKVKAIYVHYDGYPSGVGKTLLENYTDKTKIKDLIDLGGVSFLQPNITKPEGHSFNTPTKGYTVFYGRDRGDKGMEPQTYDSVRDVQENDYTYIYDTDTGKWFWTDNYGDGKRNDLSTTDFTKYKRGGVMNDREKHELAFKDKIRVDWLIDGLQEYRGQMKYRNQKNLTNQLLQQLRNWKSFRDNYITYDEIESMVISRYNDKPGKQWNAKNSELKDYIIAITDKKFEKGGVMSDRDMHELAFKDKKEMSVEKGLKTIPAVLAWDIEQFLKKQKDVGKLNKGSFTDLVRTLHSRGFEDRLNGANLRNWKVVLQKNKYAKGGMLNTDKIIRATDDLLDDDITNLDLGPKGISEKLAEKGVIKKSQINETSNFLSKEMKKQGFYAKGGKILSKEVFEWVEVYKRNNQEYYDNLNEEVEYEEEKIDLNNANDLPEVFFLEIREKLEEDGHSEEEIDNAIEEYFNKYYDEDKMFITNSYAKGGKIDIKLKDWYKKNYPTDELGEEMNDTNTFENLEDALNKGDDVYNTIGVGDSVIRERLFEHFAKIKGEKYEFIYQKWLGEGMITDAEIKSIYKLEKGGKLDEYYSKMVDKLGKKGAFERVLKDSQFGHYKGTPTNEFKHNRLPKTAIIGKNSVSITSYTPNTKRYLDSQTFTSPKELAEYLDKNQIYAKGGSVEDKEYVLERYYVYVHKDDYEEGETDNVHNWDSSDMQENNKTFSSKSALMDFIKEVIDRDTQEDNTRDDYFMIESDEDETTIDYSVLCKYNEVGRGYDNYEKATDEEKEQWKKGDLELFSVSFTFKVKVYEPRKKVEFAKGGKIEVGDKVRAVRDGVGAFSIGKGQTGIVEEITSGGKGVIIELTNGSRRETLIEDIEKHNFRMYSEGGKVEKKENNEMLIGGIAGLLLGIFLNK